MRKPNNPLQRRRFFGLFLWNVALVFGIIFADSLACASPEELYDAKSRRDPFMPLVTQASRRTASGLIGVENIDEIAIQGIIYDPKDGSMIIANDSLLKEGEEQGAVKVIKIEPSGALFSVNGIEGFKAQYQSEQPKKES